MSDQSESDPAKRQGRQSGGGPLLRSRNRREDALLKVLRRSLSDKDPASVPATAEEGTDPDETVPLTEAYRRLRCRSQAALLQDLQQLLNGESRLVEVTAATERQPRGWSVTLELSLPWQSLSPAGREAVLAYERQQQPGGSEPRALHDSRQRGSR